MADRSGIQMTGDADFFDKMSEHLLNIVERSMADAGEHLAGRATDNMPIKSGALRSSVKSVTSRNGPTVEVVLQATEPYALRMHEQLTPYGPLQLGKRSRLEAARPIPEGGPGGKFFDRVIDFNLQLVLNKLGQDIETNAPFPLTGRIDIKRLGPS